MRELLAGDDAFGAGVGAHVVDVGAAQGDELLFGCVAACAALAVEQKHLVLVFDAAGKAGLDFAQGQVDGDGQMASYKFAGSAHVDDGCAIFEVGLGGLDGDESGAPVSEKSRRITTAIRMSIQFMADSLQRRGHTWQCRIDFFAGRPAGRRPYGTVHRVCYRAPQH